MSKKTHHADVSRDTTVGTTTSCFCSCFLVPIKEPAVTFVNKEDDVVVTGYEAESATFTSYVSKESAQVRWLKDWTPVDGERSRALAEGHRRTLTIELLRRSDAGEYTCDANTDQVHFSLLVKG